MADSREERSLVSGFFEQEERDRAIAALSSPDRRGAFLTRLGETSFLDERHLKRIPPGDKLAMKVHQLLTSLGAPPQCYLLSQNNALDGNQMRLEEALNEVVGSGVPTLISCIPGKLAYYETEDGHYLLKR